MNVVEIERSVILAFAAFLLLVFVLAVALSWWQHRTNVKLIRELENRRVKRNIEMAEQMEVIEAAILRNKLTGDLNTHRSNRTQ
jgi:uncharacterized iron-regulated membrane protein